MRRPAGRARAPSASAVVDVQSTSGNATRNEAVATKHSEMLQQRYIVFRGNGGSFLRAAFARRHRWEMATASAEQGSPAMTRRFAARNPSPASSKGPTAYEENLMCTRALSEGNVAFVWRDQLCAPHWVVELMQEGQKPPLASLYSARYPATIEDGRSQVTNRWPRTSALTSKDGALRSLEAYFVAQTMSPWCFMPLSFQLPNFRLLGLADPKSSESWREVVKAHELVARGEESRVSEDQNLGHNLWLVKPTNGSGGGGITLASELRDISHALADARTNVQGFIVQKYLEAPLLFEGRKFDLRVWAVIASDAGSQTGLRVYAYREGYARTSSEPFTLPSTDRTAAAAAEDTTESHPPHRTSRTPAAAKDRAATSKDKWGSAGMKEKAVPAKDGYLELATGVAARSEDAQEVKRRERLVHLTNWCMQVHGNNCGAYEEGNAISFADLERASQGIEFYETVLPRIYALIADAALAARKELVGGLKEHGGGRRVVQLFGYDFMITASGQPFLIECNANPLIAAQNPWHEQLVTRMVDDYVGLAADGSFFDHAPPPMPRPALDGSHVSEFEGSGFVLLAGRPTESHPTPAYQVATIGGELVLDRTEADRSRYATAQPAPAPSAVAAPAASAAVTPASAPAPAKEDVKAPTARAPAATPPRAPTATPPRMPTRAPPRAPAPAPSLPSAPAAACTSPGGMPIGARGGRVRAHADRGNATLPPGRSPLPLIAPLALGQRNPARTSTDRPPRALEVGTKERFEVPILSSGSGCRRAAGQRQQPCRAVETHTAPAGRS